MHNTAEDLCREILTLMSVYGNIKIGRCNPLFQLMFRSKRLPQQPRTVLGHDEDADVADIHMITLYVRYRKGHWG